MPFKGISRGDWDPGGRALITLRQVSGPTGSAKLQGDIGLNWNTLSIGARGVAETPTSIMGFPIPYTAEVAAGARFKFSFK